MSASPVQYGKPSETLFASYHPHHPSNHPAHLVHPHPHAHGGGLHVPHPHHPSLSTPELLGGGGGRLLDSPHGRGLPNGYTIDGILGTSAALAAAAARRPGQGYKGQCGVEKFGRNL